MKDVLGNALRVGDEIVAVLQPDEERRLVAAKVVGFTRKKVRFEYASGGGFQFVSKARPENVVKLVPLND